MNSKRNHQTSWVLCDPGNLLIHAKTNEIIRPKHIPRKTIPALFLGQDAEVVKANLMRLPSLNLVELRDPKNLKGTTKLALDGRATIRAGKAPWLIGSLGYFWGVGDECSDDVGVVKPEQNAQHIVDLGFYDRGKMQFWYPAGSPYNFLHLKKVQLKHYDGEHGKMLRRLQIVSGDWTFFGCPESQFPPKNSIRKWSLQQCLQHISRQEIKVPISKEDFCRASPGVPQNASKLGGGSSDVNSPKRTPGTSASKRPHDKHPATTDDSDQESRKSRRRDKKGANTVTKQSKTPKKP